MSGGAIPVAGFPDPGGAPQGVTRLARGTCPTIGSRVPAPSGGGAPPPGGPGAGVGTTSNSQIVENESGCLRAQVPRRLAELGHVEVNGSGRRYLPSLAITAVPSDGLVLASVKPVARELCYSPKDIFSRAYVNCEFNGRPLACMLDTGCNSSVIGRKYVKNRELQPARFSLMGA